jgi:hypothetical protein
MNNSESHHQNYASETSPIESLASEYFRRANEIDERGAAVSEVDEARRVELLKELVLTPAVTARDFAAKIITHARLLGIKDDAECMSVIEASLIRDARALLGAPAA